MTRRHRPDGPGLPGAALLLLLLLLAAAPPARCRTAHAVAALPPAAAFTLPTAANGTVTLADLRTKVVLVDFWASWCLPCRQSFPWMGAMARRYGGDGLVVVAVDLDKDREAAQRFLRELAPPFTVAFDPAGTTAEAFDVRTMPSSFLVSRDGRVVYAHAGFDGRDADTMEARIKEEVAR